MEKYRVVKPYVDKYTEEYHDVGETVELEKARGKEIIEAGGYIEALPKPKKGKKNGK